ncbi:hypothetical protein [Sporichthya sp.]|uniref:hypothetical protein n=1 Tax=Sporichthya sp. TaxID=65475 RepID=UPI0017B8755E|nr:hypothetical protein [Sporichthya sp.]MBA3744509.1 hypothetical protein [Sporichthya sp.]
MATSANLQAGRGWARRARAAVGAAVATAALAALPVLTVSGPADAAAPDDGSGFPVNPAADAFYTGPASLKGVAPGAILRSRPVTIRGLGLPMPVRA